MTQNIQRSNAPFLLEKDYGKEFVSVLYLLTHHVHVTPTSACETSVLQDLLQLELTTVYRHVTAVKLSTFNVLSLKLLESLYFSNV